MLIDYRWLQSASALRRLERQNFLDDKAKMQWWYFDIVMGDGSVLMIAFVPKKWWPDARDANLGDALIFVTTMRASDRKVRSVTRTLDGAQLRVSDGPLALELPGMKLSREDGDPAIYRFAFDLPDLKGAVEVRALAQPFSAFPRGTLPSLGRKALLGGPLRGGPFSYVAQVPRGAASGALTLAGENIPVDGFAYHEQGRFDDAPERLSKGWFWCHFLHPEWNVFGSPGVFLYVQREDQAPLFRGFNLFDRSLGFKNKSTSGADTHHKVFSGGEMRFAYNGLKLSFKADPARNAALVSFPSATTRQIYHTLVTDAQLVVGERGATKEIDGQMILESCWLGL